MGQVLAAGAAIVGAAVVAAIGWGGGDDGAAEREAARRSRERREAERRAAHYSTVKREAADAGWAARRERAAAVVRDVRTPLQKKAEVAGATWMPFESVAAATSNFRGSQLIGVGGFGQVYRGTQGGRSIAVKIFKPIHDKDWLIEIDMMVKVRHRNLLALIAASGDATRRCMVMPLADGGDLNAQFRKSVRGAPMLRILHGAARGLCYMLHELDTPILHLDIKPGNILVHRGEALVADFGLAVLATRIGDRHARAARRAGGISLERAATEATMSLTPASRMSLSQCGTPGYWDPELDLSGEGEGVVSLRSDVYSFGVVMAEAVNHAFAHGAILKRDLVGQPELAVEATRRAEAQIEEQCPGARDRFPVAAYLSLVADCTEPLHDDRPWMEDVVATLQALHGAAVAATPSRAHGVSARDLTSPGARRAAGFKVTKSSASGTGRSSGRASVRHHTGGSVDRRHGGGSTSGRAASHASHPAASLSSRTSGRRSCGRASSSSSSRAVAPRARIPLEAIEEAAEFVCLDTALSQPHGEAPVEGAPPVQEVAAMRREKAAAEQAAREKAAADQAAREKAAADQAAREKGVIFIVSNAGNSRFNGGYVLESNTKFRKVGGGQETVGHSTNYDTATGGRWFMCLNYGAGWYSAHGVAHELPPTKGWGVSAKGKAPSPTLRHL